MTRVVRSVAPSAQSKGDRLGPASESVFPLGAFLRQPEPLQSAMAAHILPTSHRRLDGALEAGLPIVRGLIGGSMGAPTLPIRVLLDTGADGFYISDELATRAALFRGPAAIVNVPGGVFQGQWVEGALSLFGKAHEQIDMRVTGTTLPRVPPVCDVLLGMSVLRLFRFELRPDGTFSLDAQT